MKSSSKPMSRRTLQAGSPAELQALLASEIKRWSEVIRAAKIEPE